MSRSIIILAVLAVAALLTAASALFTVTEAQQAIVLQFGDPKRVIREPGLKVKLPFIQDVVYYDDRVLDLDPPYTQIILADQKRINVDSYLRYRIVDPLRFYQTVTTEQRLRERMRQVIDSNVREVLGKVDLSGVLSARRAELMRQIQAEVGGVAERLGIEVVDVRIGRTDLPDETSQAVYNRMKSERERDARELRAQGYEAAQLIRAEADRERVVILAEAQRQAEILRGEGEAQATRIRNEAHSQDRRFFDFYRSLNAYREALNPDGTTFVMSPDSEFFRYFQGVPGKPPVGTASGSVAGR